MFCPGRRFGSVLVVFGVPEQKGSRFIASASADTHATVALAAASMVLYLLTLLKTEGVAPDACPPVHRSRKKVQLPSFFIYVCGKNNECNILGVLLCCRDKRFDKNF